ncbi:regulator of microtubule dynamics protein 1-like [Macrosteles quadrilineatus]|uniref:regulator of microtubule dynamics protein 1-like n=1 Tax=Macrosteles quadrilineatus TaxID=74068 RepID=UPI0023E23D42|nr:regulator of microtubule dynamics protein 1-like [Macrosteles quadrilineatus]
MMTSLNKLLFNIFATTKKLKFKPVHHKAQHFSTSNAGFLYRSFKISKNPFLFISLFFIKSKRPFLLLWGFPFLPSKEEDDNSNAIQPKNVNLKKQTQKAVVQSDELFNLNKFEEAASTLLPFQDAGDVEVLWRLARAQYKQSQQSGVVEPQRRQLIESAYDELCIAITHDPDHWAVHKWMSVLLDARFTYDGVKARVTQLSKVKEHMLKAAELNPSDATTLYMIGSWCYQIADMPWYQRKIAATIFAEPPKSSFEEALQYFSKAEEVQPRFYSQNLLMVGKTLLKLQRPTEAYDYLVQARDFPSSSDEDDQVRKEAAEILKNLKTNEKQ